MTHLSLLPEVTFPSIYRHFMERSFRAVAVVERETITCTKTPREDLAVGVDVDKDAMSSDRGIEKGYKTFDEGNVQKISFAQAVLRHLANVFGDARF